MKKRLLLIFFWLVVSPVVCISLISIAYLSNYKYKTVPLAQQPLNDINLPINAAASEYKPILGISTDVEVEDARPIIIAEFLEKHDSPLKPYDYWGEFLTQLADTYNLDYRLLPSISMQESNLCKKIPEGTFNCLGLGIHSQGTWGFDRFEDNFEAAASILKKNYIDKGYVTPDEIQDKYTPGSNGSWEFAVNHFMEILEYADF
jgi:hypothetical protein